MLHLLSPFLDLLKIFILVYYLKYNKIDDNLSENPKVRAKDTYAQLGRQRDVTYPIACQQVFSLCSSF